MDRYRLINYLLTYGYTPKDAEDLASQLLGMPKDADTKQALVEAKDYSTLGVSPQELNNKPVYPTPGRSAVYGAAGMATPPGAIVMPVGGKPRTITVADIANAAPPSAAEFGISTRAALPPESLRSLVWGSGEPALGPGHGGTPARTRNGR